MPVLSAINIYPPIPILRAFTNVCKYERSTDVEKTPLNWLLSFILFVISIDNSFADETYKSDSTCSEALSLQFLYHERVRASYPADRSFGGYIKIPPLFSDATVIQITAENLSTKDFIISNAFFSSVPKREGSIGIVAPTVAARLYEVRLSTASCTGPTCASALFSCCKSKIKFETSVSTLLDAKFICRLYAS